MKNPNTIVSLTEDIKSIIGEELVVDLGLRGQLTLTLIKVNTESHQSGVEKLSSLFFKGSNLFSQIKPSAGILQHKRLNNIIVQLIPIGPYQDGLLYEAVAI